MRLLLFGFFSFAVFGCDTCPPGYERVRADRLACDDVTRMCETRSVEYCQCQGNTCAEPPPTCNAITGVRQWQSQEPLPNPHVVDGAFTGAEWEGATSLQGLFTDVYLDYRDGRLHFLNDWRANDEGIRPTCFNYFQIRLGTQWIELRVFGDGRVTAEVDGEDVSHEVEGAYGFGPSPEQPVPHTIYEFSLAADTSQIDVCCFDPITESSCERLAREPMVVSIRNGPAGVAVHRTLRAGSVDRLPEGARCSEGQGICEDGLRCVVAVDGPRRCEGAPSPAPPDAGLADSGPPE